MASLKLTSYAMTVSPEGNASFSNEKVLLVPLDENGEIIKNKGRIMHKEFQVHMLNERGKQKANDLASAFNDLLNKVHEINPEPSPQMDKVREHLELASFYAKKAMASNVANNQ